MVDISVRTENRRQVSIARTVKDKSREAYILTGHIVLSRVPEVEHLPVSSFLRAISDLSVTVGERNVLLLNGVGLTHPEFLEE
jgi:hypothetical protein